jgi:purine-binding chemotaxis protein CheW
MPPIGSQQAFAPPMLRVVAFRLHDQRYAVPMGEVLEVIASHDAERAFPTPGDLVGVYDLRGEPIPIVDLRRRFGIGGELGGDRQVLICRVKDCVVGFLVDEVLHVMKVPRAQIGAPPAAIAAIAPGHVIGVTSQDGVPTTIIGIAARASADAEA